MPVQKASVQKASGAAKAIPKKKPVEMPPLPDRQQLLLQELQRVKQTFSDISDQVSKELQVMTA